MATHSVFSPGKYHGQRSLVGYGPWSRKKADTTEATEYIICIIYTVFCIFYDNIDVGETVMQVLTDNSSCKQMTNLRIEINAVQ